MATQLIIPRQLDANGDPASGAKAYVYETGTTTPVTVYTNTGLSIAHASPIVADSAGYFAQAFYGGSTALKVVVTSSADATLVTYDPVPLVSLSSAAASDITFAATTEIPQTNVQAAIVEPIVTARLANDAVTRAKIADAAMSGADATLVTGTAGTSGNLAQWNADGDLVDASVAVTAGAANYGAMWDANGDLVTSGGYARWNIQSSQATTSGTAFDYTGIPSGVQEISIILDAVNLSGTDDIYIQIGDSGGIETSGYSGQAFYDNGNSTFSAAFTLDRVSGFTSGGVRMLVTLRKMSSGHLWGCSFAGSTGTLTWAGGGTKTLTGELDRVRITRSGTDTFTAGSLNISYR